MTSRYQYEQYKHASCAAADLYLHKCTDCKRIFDYNRLLDNTHHFQSQCTGNEENKAGNWQTARAIHNRQLNRAHTDHLTKWPQPVERQRRWARSPSINKIEISLCYAITHTGVNRLRINVVRNAATNTYAICGAPRVRVSEYIILAHGRPLFSIYLSG